MKKLGRKGKLPFATLEIIGNGAFLLSLQGENSHEILIFFAVNMNTDIKLKVLLMKYSCCGSPAFTLLPSKI